MQMRVLVVEDDIQTATYVRDSLSGIGIEVETALDGETGLARAGCADFDVLIVDRMLPKLDGLALVEALRADKVETPVLFLSAMGSIADRVAGLGGGGDDYLVKPFSPAELNARVVALARRPALRPDASTQIQVADLVLDRLERSARRDGQEIALLPLQFRVLEFLMLNKGQIVTRSMLLEHVWGFRFDPQTNIVETHISHLRARIDRPGLPPLIATVRGAGYLIRDE